MEPDVIVEVETMKQTNVVVCDRVEVEEVKHEEPNEKGEISDDDDDDAGLFSSAFDLMDSEFQPEMGFGEELNWMNV